MGLSPRVRGKHWHLIRPAYRQRSIPACAGETPRRLYAPGIRKVYPRVCGGNRRSALSSFLACGLSPRVRGKRNIVHPVSAGMRSIPACAGETHYGDNGSQVYQVYPRVCGGNQRPLRLMALPCGLSPRVRGKPLDSGSAGGAGRSIPACAGETAHRGLGGRQCEVYPRVCGGN